MKILITLCIQSYAASRQKNLAAKERKKNRYPEEEAFALSAFFRG